MPPKCPKCGEYYEVNRAHKCAESSTQQAPEPRCGYLQNGLQCRFEAGHFGEHNLTVPAQQAEAGDAKRDPNHAPRTLCVVCGKTSKVFYICEDGCVCKDCKSLRNVEEELQGATSESEMCETASSEADGNFGLMRDMYNLAVNSLLDARAELTALKSSQQEEMARWLTAAAQTSLASQAKLIRKCAEVTDLFCDCGSTSRHDPKCPRHRILSYITPEMEAALAAEKALEGEGAKPPEQI